MPFRNHEMATTELTDSLYYSFSVLTQQEADLLPAEDEALWDDYTPVGQMPADSTDQETVEEVAATDSCTIGPCGINPLIIKAIQTKKFTKSLIATREFELRLSTIFATCDDAVLELYINNADKNLWEIDKMAAQQLGSKHKQYKKFLEFASLEQTKVKLSDRRAELLAKHYEKEKKKVENEILALRKELRRKQIRLEKI
jgi:hypothetical protein